MSIWIIAVALLVFLALAGWGQGGIVAAFYFCGAILGALFGPMLGGIFHFLLPHLGVDDPLLTWLLAPICGFILVTVILTSIGMKISRQIEVRFKHKESELRHAMFQRLNTKLGILIGLMNGAVYFVLVSFVFYNIAYFTTQAAASSSQPLQIRLINQLGADMSNASLGRVAAGVHTLPPSFYEISDLAGFLAQNPSAGPRFATYPGLTSLWQRDDMQPVVTDAVITNALAGGNSLNTVLDEAPLQDFLKNKPLRDLAMDTITTNIDDLKTYLKTGKSSKYADNIIGEWTYNINVTLAWWRLGQSRVPASEMMAIRQLWTKAYGQTAILATGDHQIFISNFPHFNEQPRQAPTIDEQNLKGDWSVDNGTNYTLHVTMNGEDKFMEATADALRMSAKDGRTLMIFDRAF